MSNKCRVSYLVDGNHATVDAGGHYRSCGRQAEVLSTVSMPTEPDGWEVVTRIPLCHRHRDWVHYVEVRAVEVEEYVAEETRRVALASDRTGMMEDAREWTERDDYLDRSPDQADHE